MGKKVLLGVLGLVLLVGGSAWAITLPSEKAMTVTASVTSDIDFSVAIYKSNGKDANGNATFDWNTNLYPNIAFGTLVPGDPTKADSARAAANAFMAYVICKNNSGKQYLVKYTGASLKIGTTSTKLSDDCWVVQGGLQTGASDGFNTAYSTGLNQVIHSGSATYDVYTSTATGTTDVFRVYFGITGDPAKTVSGTNTNLILPTQAAGDYSAAVKLTMYNP